MRSIPITLLNLAGFAALFAPTATLAQDAGDPARAELSGQSSSGAVAANVAAGDANQQANVGLVALGSQAYPTGTVSQSMRSQFRADGSGASAAISDNAFAGSSGWIAANVAAGSANQSANVAAISIGLSGQALTTAILSQTRAPSEKSPSGSDGMEQSRYSTRIGDGAFAGSSGLVQLNVVAGDENTSANVFALSIAGP